LRIRTELISAIVLLLCFMPLLLVLSAIGKCYFGSSIFRQVRVGKCGRHFVIWKFRSLKVGTSSVPTHMLRSEDICSYGSFLRKTKADELPQLVNIILGEMSFFGPRPCLPDQHELIQARIANGSYLVRPGVTGVAQALGIDMKDVDLCSRLDALNESSIFLNFFIMGASIPLPPVQKFFKTKTRLALLHELGKDRLP
jgi:O-antigen biosynthesis protein WbqP